MTKYGRDSEVEHFASSPTHPVIGVEFHE